MTRQITVIGAGIAGASVAWLLAKRGWQVRVLDAAKPGAGGSGNAAAILYPKLVSAALTTTHIQSQAFLRALEVLSDPQLAPHYQASGVLWLQTRKQRANITDDHPWWQRQVWALSTDEASAKAGIRIPMPALWLPNAGIIDPAGLLTTIFAHPNIELLGGHEVTRIEPDGSQWRLTVCRRSDEVQTDIELTAAALIVAAAGAGARLLQSRHLAMKPVRGQISQLPTCLPLKTTLCYGGYLTPALHGQHVLGATFQPGREDCSPSSDDQQANWQALIDVLPDLAEQVQRPDQHRAWKARASLRWQTPDYLPLVGWLPWPPQHEALLSTRSPSRPQPEAVEALPKLGVSLGHGSKGFSQAWLAADVLCRELFNDIEISAGLSAWRERLRPDRFLLKAWKRGQLRTSRPT